MLKEFGELLGWLIIISYVGTILNFIIKFTNKRWGKSISANVTGKKIIGILMKIFVRNHKYFGLAAATFLILHFLIQFSTYGINFTGGLAAGLLLLQVVLGGYATLKKKPRKGVWFILHRVIALLLIAGVALHLIIPFALNGIIKPVAETNPSTGGNTTAVTASVSVTPAAASIVFTLDELSQYNGQDGQPAYVAYEGIVYDVTDIAEWKNGKHNGQKAGTDLTNEISKSPHGASVFETLPVVGTLTE